MEKIVAKDLIKSYKALTLKKGIDKETHPTLLEAKLSYRVYVEGNKKELKKGVVFPLDVEFKVVDEIIKPVYETELVKITYHFNEDTKIVDKELISGSFVTIKDIYKLAKLVKADALKISYIEKEIEK